MVKRRGVGDRKLRKTSCEPQEKSTLMTGYRYKSKNEMTKLFLDKTIPLGNEIFLIIALQ